VLGGELLPAGWRVKFHKKLFDYKYLTREMEVLGGSDEALKHITGNDEYDNDSVDIFKKWVTAMCDSLPKIKWVEDINEVQEDDKEDDQEDDNQEEDQQEGDQDEDQGFLQIVSEAFTKHFKDEMNPF